MTTLNKGNSYLLEIQVVDESGVPKDISDTQDIRYIMSMSVNAPTSYIEKDLSSPDVLVGDAINGIVSVKLTNDDTDDVPVGRAYQEALLIDISGNYSTILCENITIKNKILL